MTASAVFTLAMLFNMLKFPINQAGQLLSKAALGVQAMQRISQFIVRESKEHSPGTDISEGSDSIVLEVKNGEFYVGSESAEASSDANEDNNQGSSGFTLSGINFNVARGEVLAVVGEVASGERSNSVNLSASR